MDVVTECGYRRVNRAPESYAEFELEVSLGTSLVAQVASEGGLGSIPSQGNRPHMLQPKIPHAAMKTLCSQINKYRKIST